MSEGSYGCELGRIGHFLYGGGLWPRDLGEELLSVGPSSTHLFGKARSLGEHPQIRPSIHEQQNDIADEQSHCVSSSLLYIPPVPRDQPVGLFRWMIGTHTRPITTYAE